jgi:hypothetical protein
LFARFTKKRYHDHNIDKEVTGRLVLYLNTNAQEVGNPFLSPDFVQALFSLYHGWTLALVIMSDFEAFSVDAHKHKAGVLTKALVFIALFLLEGTGAGYSLYHPRRTPNNRLGTLATRIYTIPSS